MNLVQATLRDVGEGLVADLGAAGISRPLPGAIAAAARAGNKQNVWFGFRPEELGIATAGGGINLGITFVERIGARTIVHLDAGGTPAKGVFDNSVPVGNSGTLSIVPAEGAIRLFDRQTGTAIVGN